MSTSSMREVQAFHARLQSAAADVFPLLCPVREYEWIEGWSCELVHTRSGVVEEGCIFNTAARSGRTTTWVTTRHDPLRHEVEFTRVTAGESVVGLALAVADDIEGGAHLHVRYTIHPVGAPGEDLVRELRALGFAPLRERVRWMAAALDHFLATGDRLPRPQAASYAGV